MKNFIRILKASTAGNFNIFRIKTKSSILNIVLILFLSFALLMSFVSYAFMFASPLHDANLTYVMLAIFMFLSTIMVFMEGIYKSRGILFDSKDNDLLFSMPIKKSTILNVRVFYLLIFQYIFELMFILPALTVYIFFEKPNILFYFVSVIMIILLPIIPTLLSCILGYFIQIFSNVFKKKKFFQTIFSVALSIGILFFSFSTSNESFFKNIVGSADNITNIITKIYYPIGLYIRCITNFKIFDLVIFILISIIPIFIYIYFFSIKYSSLISKSSENYSSNKKTNVKTNITKTTPLGALLKKELSRYFSSSIYIINTLFGPILILIFAINSIFNFENSINSAIQSGFTTVDSSIIISFFPKIYMIMLLAILPTINTAASSISLEGSSIYIIKSLPLKPKTIFLAKILTQDIISSLTLLVSTLILIFARHFSIIDSIILILICLILPNLYAILGLIINLKFPLLNAKSDTVVVKQSMSCLISLLLGFTISFIPIGIYFKLGISNISFYAFVVLFVFTLLTFLLWKFLNNYGAKKFLKL